MIDEGLIKSGVFEGFFVLLCDVDVVYEIFLGVEVNLSMVVFDSVLMFLKEYCCIVVIGVGGGSSIDMVKGVVVMVINGGMIFDYEGYNKILDELLLIFVILIMLGIGSECMVLMVFMN